ncbi:hypothetical protein [Streptomyces sp. CA-111067]|uniref:hypothetical protein n=1 Tax=Streptomyces sp. CA-111067 TaxID=3240046 RepID=UPI003D97B6A4
MSVVALTAACGADDDGSIPVRMKAAPATPSASATPGETAKVLGQRDLDRLALNARDLPGYRVSDIVGKGAPVGPGPLAVYRAVTPSECRPIYAAAESRSLHSVSAQVEEDVVYASDAMGRHASVGLSSYRADDAQQVMTELRAALSRCTTAAIRPSASHPGDGLEYHSPYQRTAPGVGDETLAFEASEVADGGRSLVIPLGVLVVRRGATVVTFASLNPTATPVIPDDIVHAQMDKLG